MSSNRSNPNSLVDTLLSLSLSDEDDDYETNNNNFIHEELAKTEKLKLMNIPAYAIPTEILEIERSDDLVNCAHTVAEYRSDERKYIDTYKKMIYFEEAAQTEFLSQFNRRNITIVHSGLERLFYMKDDKKSSISEAIDEGILECFTLKSLRRSVRIVINGILRGKKDDKIVVEIYEECFDYVRRNCKKELYDIYFHVNRTPFQLQHNALKLMLEHKLFGCLINNSKYDDDTDQLGMRNGYTFSGKLSSKLNEEQQTAVMNIVEAKNFPLPYLLFGPAGTGKTHTLVAAIEEIVRSSSKCVLVCSNSNVACDEICERLVNVLQIGEMFRMYAKSYNPQKIRDKMKPICNWLNEEYHFPSLNFLYQFRVLICTVAVAGYLTKSLEDPHFKPNHFSHVIIDECASTHETVSLIAIAGLSTSYNRIESSIVLAGDPKQLDAVTKSQNAEKLGFKTSLMEHLYKRRLYQRNPTTDEYNQTYITQLVKNYRSHPSILHVPNILFYGNKLQAKASPEITDCYIGSDLLPSKKFPMIFKTVQGCCMRLNRDFSMFNLEEVNAVMIFIKKLLENNVVIINGKSISQSDIGITSPYKLQCKQIARACRKKKFDGITIGSAEIFQGHEKPIMIVSTVRTNGKIGDFVNNPQRFNVVITRAKCLLIVVGDPYTLRLDKTWKTFIEYCDQNNALI